MLRLLRLLLRINSDSYFIKNNQSDSVTISDSEFFNRELE